jgi:lysophospholipase L1-like esterase
MNIKNYIKQKNENPLDNIPLNGGMCRIFRKIACVGDSLSSGEFQIRNEDGSYSYYDMFEYSWGQHIARMTGSEVYNFSRGGMTTKEYCENFADASGFWNPCKACQAYIIALGANDRNCDEMGTIDDIDFNDYHNNKPTYAGYYAKIVQRYKEIQPRAKFFFVTLPHEETDKKNSECRALLEEMAEHFDNAYLIDLYTYAPEYDAQFKKMFFLNGHLNPGGYVFTADMIAAYIDYIIRNNIDDFNEIGFIGTDITDKKE